MKLIIAEKPNVCKQLKDAIEPRSVWKEVRKASKYVVGYYEGSQYIFTAAQGHLFELKAPGEINPDYIKWKMDTLPMTLPDKIPLKASSADKAYFKMIETLVKRSDIDEILIATDPDNEGQHIYEKIKLMITGFPSIKESRLWIKEWTEKGLKEALDNRKDNSDYDGLRIAAECREEADAIIGWNDSRAGTLKFGGQKNVISLGRVQTPTNYFVVSRELEIQNFKPEPYSVLALELNSNTKETGIFKYVAKDERLTKEKADNIYKVVNSLTSTKVTVKNKKTSNQCMLLYNTIDVQKDMNKLYGFTAEQTSNCLQSLYLAGLTTYPRTEAKQVSKSTAQEAKKALNSLFLSSMGNSFIKEALDNNYELNSNVITGSNLAHEAITPSLGAISEAHIKSLKSDEQKVYEAIIKRFVQAFFPKCVIVETSAFTTIEVNGDIETFEAKGKTVISNGWTKVMGINKNQVLADYTDGGVYNIVNVKKEEKTTTPPARYTEAGLLDAMDNAGRFLDDKSQAKILKDCEGIGTGATRDAIIKGLKSRGYIELKGKTIYPTSKSIELFAILPESPITSPAMTAELESDLREIEKGVMTKAEFMKKVKEQVKDFIEAVKKCDKKEVGISKSVTTNIDELICPLCGGKVLENSKGYYCANWKTGCKFSVNKSIKGKTITKAVVKSLIKDGKTGVIKGFVMNDKTVDAALKIKDGKVAFDFNSNAKKDFDVCPVCGKEMIENDKCYTCTGYKDGCKTTIWKNALEKLGKDKISKTEAKQLLAGKEIIVALVSKAGKPYKAKAKYSFSTNRIELSWL